MGLNRFKKRINDNTVALIFDDYKGKMFTQWINSEDLKLLNNPIKIPSFSFNYNELIKEYNFLEKKLRILYSKNALSDIILSLNRIEYNIPLKKNNNLFELQLNNWKKFNTQLKKINGIYLLQTIGAIIKAMHILDENSKGKNYLFQRIS